MESEASRRSAAAAFVARACRSPRHRRRIRAGRKTDLPPASCAFTSFASLAERLWIASILADSDNVSQERKHRRREEAVRDLKLNRSEEHTSELQSPDHLV